jgi:organic radical activating enzyme
MDKSLDEKYSKTFCIYPWTSLMVNTSGSIDYCCIAKPSVLRGDDGKILDIGKTTLKEAWNSKDMKRLREGMINGEFIKGCEHCYMQERVGKTSFREMHNNEWLGKLGAERVDELVAESIINDFELETPPVYLDLRLGNLCNLTCRMCNVFNSSQIVKEHDRLYNEDEKYTKIFKKTYGNPPAFIHDPDYETKFDDNILWTNVYDWLPTIRKMYFTGGEPTLIKNTLEFLKLAADQGHAGHIQVFMNTNCTNVNKSFLESISHYEQVLINASLDGIGEVNELIRRTKSWDIILRNYKSMLALPNVTSNITPVLQIYNLNKIHEILILADELSDEMYGEDSTKSIGVDILLNTHPHYLDIRNLPLELRQDAKKRLEQFKEEYTLYDKNWLVKNSVDGILGYLSEPQLENWKENLQDFLEMTAIWDRQRNQSFSAIDDELYTAIKRLVADE